jgi:hypothetical protein
MNRYGYIDQSTESNPLAVWIWGHRLRIGQHWMEYLLEFLGVLSGFGYELGQGINEGVNQHSPKLEYIRFTRLGLRRFVFYDEREKTRHPSDDQAYKLLQQVLKERIIAAGGSEQDALKQLRMLFRAYSAVEEQRSWYAKSLFPAHENFLLWEALRKGATKIKYTRPQVQTDTSPLELDDDIVFDARNFFARGGEIYYLLLSAGTQNFPEQRHRIAKRLEELLTASNQALGRVAGIVDDAWQRLASDDSEGKDNGASNKKGHVGWIPDPDCPLYQTFANDLDTFLQSNLDSLETLYLLAHLLCFHLVLYIYHRAHPNATVECHANRTCIEICHLTLLIDVLEGGDEKQIRDVSAALFQEQEARIIKKGREYVRQQVQNWVLEFGDDTVILQAEAGAYFNLKKLSRPSLQPFELKVGNLQAQLRTSKVKVDTFIEGFADALTDILIEDFRKNFLGVHSKLAKRAGFVAPRKGPAARFVLGDNLLKALVLANAPVRGQMTFDGFLRQLYKNYGLVIGPEEANLAGLFDRHRINADYYDRNRLALLDKMKYAGLVIEYSDATAMIANTVRGF